MVSEARALIYGVGGYWTSFAALSIGLHFSKSALAILVVAIPLVVWALFFGLFSLVSPLGVRVYDFAERFRQLGQHLRLMGPRYLARCCVVLGRPRWIIAVMYLALATGVSGMIAFSLWPPEWAQDLSAR